MWMLYGGMDGNGAMIDFDRRTLQNAMGRESYDCGYFDSDGSFQRLLKLPSENLKLKLVDVLYCQSQKGDRVTIGRSSLEGGASIWIIRLLME